MLRIAQSSFQRLLPLRCAILVARTAWSCVCLHRYWYLGHTGTGIRPTKLPMQPLNGRGLIRHPSANCTVLTPVRSLRPDPRFVMILPDLPSHTGIHEEIFTQIYKPQTMGNVSAWIQPPAARESICCHVCRTGTDVFSPQQCKTAHNTALIRLPGTSR